MNDKEKSVVSFHIDDTPTAEQASKNFQDDYELDFQDFLERTLDESAAEDFSYSNNGVKKAGRRLRKKEGDLKSATATIQQFRAAYSLPCWPLLPRARDRCEAGDATKALRNDSRQATA